MGKDSKRTLVQKEELIKLKESASEKDKYLDALQRMKAEFDNYKKRMQKEKEQFKQYIIEDFIIDLLPVLDNLERALDSAQTHDIDQTFMQGIQMVHRQFLDFLGSHGASRIQTQDEKFDPFYHEAILQEPSDSIPEGTIIKDILPGYTCNDKILRHSKVVVSKGTA